MNDDNNEKIVPNNTNASNHVSLAQIISSGNIELNNNEEIINNSNVEDETTSPIPKGIKTNQERKKEYLSNGELLYAFIGKNYQKFITRFFNFPALFFSIVYLLYRKMYFYSFVVTIIYILLSIFIKNPLYLGCGILFICTLLFIFTNKLYLRFSRNKIEDIRYKYPYLDNEQMLNKCRHVGGTSIISVIFGFILNMAIIILMLGAYLYFILKIPVESLFKGMINLYSGTVIGEKIGIKEDEPGEYHGKYNGQIWFNMVDIKSKYAVDIPSQFTNDSSYNSYKYEYDTIDENCEFTLYSVEGYSSADKFIDEVIDYENNNAPRKGEKEYNDIKWITVNFNDTFGNRYYYATEKNNQVFVSEYTIKESKNNECNAFHVQIISSIKNK